MGIFIKNALAPGSGSSTNALNVNTNGIVNNNNVNSNSLGVRGVAFLKSGIEYVSGDGSENYPYAISFGN